MGLFDGNSGFQGPGEEFGNSWDSFRTGRGNFMTDGQGNKSNFRGEWSHTGGFSPFSGPKGVFGSPRPGARPGGSTFVAPEQAPGLLAGGIPGILDLLGGGGRMGKKERAAKERGLLQNTLLGNFVNSVFGRDRGV